LANRPASQDSLDAALVAFNEGEVTRKPVIQQRQRLVSPSSSGAGSAARPWARSCSLA
jgi:hypothetical protein